MAPSKFDEDLVRVAKYYAEFKPCIFEKRIASRKLQEDGTEDVTLECGHTSCYIMSTHPLMQFGFCAQCVDDYMETHRKPVQG